MPATPNFGFRYPAATDAPDGPGALYALALDVDNALIVVPNNAASIQMQGAMQTITAWENVLAKEPDRMITFNFGWQLLSGTIFDGFLMAVLPTGSRPASIVNTPALVSDGTTWRPGGITIGTDGAVRAIVFGVTGLKQIAGSVSFPAFS